MEGRTLTDRGFLASFEISVKCSKNETPTPKRLESLIVEAEDDYPYKALAAAYSLMVLEVVREGYGFPDGAVTTHTAVPHKMNVIDLQAASPSPDASCVVEMCFCDWTNAPRKHDLRVVAEGDDPFVALNAAYGRLLYILGVFHRAAVTQIDGK